MNESFSLASVPIYNLSLLFVLSSLLIANFTLLKRPFSVSTMTYYWLLISKKSLLSFYLTFPLLLTPSTITYYLLDSDLSLGSLVLLFPYSNRTSPTASIRFPLTISARTLFSLPLGFLKVQSLVLFFFLFTLPLLATSSQTLKSNFISTLMILNFSFLFLAQTLPIVSQFCPPLLIPSISGSHSIAYLLIPTRLNIFSLATNANA